MRQRNVRLQLLQERFPLTMNDGQADQKGVGLR
jgi:hypothetical protein